MRLAFCLFKYNVFSGLALDFLHVAQACQARGHQIDVFTKDWRGDRPKGFNVHEITVKKWRNFRQNEEFIRKVKAWLPEGNYDCIIGFNKMPGLDIYFAADGCFKTQQGWRRVLPLLIRRYRFYIQCEHSVFNPESKTKLLMLSKLQIVSFQQHYAISESRYKILPPGITKVNINLDYAKTLRSSFRREFNLSHNDKVLLMVGSGFKTKGLDRAIKSLARLPQEIKLKTRLFVVGEGKQQGYVNLAKKLRVEDRIYFFGGRNDVSRFLLGCDILIHPAITETAGKVILEAIVHGLPVLTTESCGYADYVNQANAGRIAKSPFEEKGFADLLAEMLSSSRINEWSTNGFNYGKNQDLFSMPEEVVRIIEAR